MSVLNHHGIPRMVDVYIESSWIIVSQPDSSPLWTEWSMQYHAMSCHAMPCHALLSVILVSISPPARTVPGATRRVGNVSRTPSPGQTQRREAAAKQVSLKTTQKYPQFFKSTKSTQKYLHHWARLKELKPLPSKWGGADNLQPNPHKNTQEYPKYPIPKYPKVLLGYL